MSACYRVDAELKLFSATAHMHRSKDRNAIFPTIYLPFEPLCDAVYCGIFQGGGGTGVALGWQVFGGYVGSLTCQPVP